MPAELSHEGPQPGSTEREEAAPLTPREELELDHPWGQTVGEVPPEPDSSATEVGDDADPAKPTPDGDESTTDPEAIQDPIERGRAKAAAELAKATTTQPEIGHQDSYTDSGYQSRAS